MTSETIPKSRLDEIQLYLRGHRFLGQSAQRIADQQAAAAIDELLYSRDTIEALSAQVAEHDAHVARLIEHGQQAEYERGKAVDALASAEAKVEELTKERDEAITDAGRLGSSLLMAHAMVAQSDANLSTAESSLASVTAERDAMREALKPAFIVAETSDSQYRLRMNFQTRDELYLAADCIRTLFLASPEVKP